MNRPQDQSTFGKILFTIISTAGGNTFGLALSVGPHKGVVGTGADNSAEREAILYGAGLVGVAGPPQARVHTLRLDAGQLGRTVLVHPAFRFNSLGGCRE
jgi:hypothetical protein